MNYKSIRNILSKILFLDAIITLLPSLICLIYKEPFINGFSYIIVSNGLILISLLIRIKTNNNYELRSKEGFAIVGLSWILISLFGTLPLIINKEIPNFFDAFFEICSGFSTTGSSILTNVENCYKSTLFYRSLTQWIGGMGILVFILSIMNNKEESNSIHLLRAETTGPSIGKLSSKMKFTTRILYIIYIGFTLLEIIMLLLGKNSLFTSTCLSLSTMATGGFSVLNTGVNTYSIYTQYVLIIFMFLAGINFSLYYYILIRKFKRFFKNEELITYVLIVVISTIIIFINIINKYETVEEAIRYSLFSAVSTITTTGFSIIDYTIWPSICLMIIILLTLIGSCAGSTAGGLKISRLLIVSKSIAKRIKNKCNENRIEVTKLDNVPLDENTIKETKTFVLVYISIWLICGLLISIDGTNDLLTNLTASLTCISNVGPGLGNVGPVGNFANYSWFSKYILSLEMLTGRLEIFPILILFNNSTWRKY